MKAGQKCAIALCVLTLLASQSAWAASSRAEFIVSGILVASACEVQLSNGGVIDYGNISANKIHDDPKGTSLGISAPIYLTINCGSTATQVGVDLSDSKVQSRVDQLVIASPVDNRSQLYSNATNYGLGMSNGKKIGVYAVEISHGIVDGAASEFTHVKIPELSFTHAPTDYLLLSANELSTRSSLATWVMKDAKAPAIGKLFKGDIKVSATVNNKKALDLSKEIKLNGEATLTVYYL